ncbi:putative flavoprotein involved in K+ transport [Nonomuraea maritima]|uniref:Putative flavoprotein involved in K+ transport n=1 Tax=Nonomuraea maritima TaxID=683260 RepID=A0A1G9RNM5_9ACTN|nr:NAD(P)-binding domain-containing protein [Nonomuraea maritima]SDM24888.1 putative flavoprotein involved in K+ transport [Nonomuraea maritima]
MPGRNPAERVDTVVVGGGAAGLAVGWQLRRRGRSFVILDSAARVGDSWRERYECLRLFTPAAFCGLPGLPVPLPASAHPNKDEIADYLEEYAKRFELPVRSGVAVTAHRWENGVHRIEAGGTRIDSGVAVTAHRWENGVHRIEAGGTRIDSGVAVTAHRWENGVHRIEAGGTRIEAARLIVATGACSRPVIPGFAAQLDPAVRHLHSARYRRPADLRPGPVLVVGAGTAGADIALDLASGHEVHLSGRPTGRVPLAVVRSAAVRRLYGVRVPPGGLGRVLTGRLLRRGSPLRWQTEADLTAAGIRRVPRTAGVRHGRPLLADGRVLDVANVVWCTGLRPDLGWLTPGAVGPDGRPAHRHGISTTVPSLGFVGMPFQHTFASGFLGGMSDDAEHVVRRLS